MTLESSSRIVAAIAQLQESFSMALEALAAQDASNPLAGLEVMTVREAADFLRCNEDTVWRRVKSGKLRGFQLDGVQSPMRILRSDLANYIHAQLSASAPAAERNKVTPLRQPEGRTG